MTDVSATQDTTADERVLKGALDVFQKCVEREADNRADYLDDLRFARLGEQWHKDDIAARKRDGRPCLTVNKMPAFIRQVVNDARQNKPAIVVHPADDDADPETAQVISDLIRNIEVSSNAEVAYDTSLDLAVSGGWGYFRINKQYSSDDTFEQDLVIDPVEDTMSVYGDPYSVAADSANWNHAFVVRQLPKDEFEGEYKDAEQVDWESGPYSDIPADWQDGDMITVAEYWKRVPSLRLIVALSNGSVVGLEEFNDNKADFDAESVTQIGKPRTVRSHKVVQYIMSGVEVLEKVDWPGRYIPIIPVYGEVIVVEGRRHIRSMVRDAKDAQRRLNYHTSAVTELVALAPKAPFIGRKGAFETDAAKWETANAVSHAYIEYDGQEPPQRQGFAGVPAGEVQQALQASDDMKAIMGLHDASLGARSNETSGVAIHARQAEGDVSTFNFTDNLARAIRHAGRVLIDLIPSTYPIPRTLRVMGVDGTPKNVRVNEEHAPESEDADGPDNENGERLRIFDLTVGKYDLVVKSGPSFTTRREEAASQMIELIRAFPAAAGVIGDLLAKNLDWPGADEVAKRLHALLPPEIQKQLGVGAGAKGQPQGVSPEAAQAHQMIQQQTAAIGQYQAALQQLNDKYKAMQADQAMEARKLDIAEYEAETKRMEAKSKSDVAMFGVLQPPTQPPQQPA